MRTAVSEARFPLAVPSAAEAEAAAERIGKQLDDYLLPRVRRLDAPLLVVVGGSTGAGKSTLVNSIVQAPVSSASVLRPTTRSPVLVSNPADTGWFTERHILPGLNRATAAKTNEYTLQVISAPALRPGTGAAGRARTSTRSSTPTGSSPAQLLAAADLWLFVTTAARYADAVPWRMLKIARDRGTVLALVLDRVPDGAEDEIAAHLREMLAEPGSAKTPACSSFRRPASTARACCRTSTSAPIRDYLNNLAGDAARASRGRARHRARRRTRGGDRRRHPRAGRRPADPGLERARSRGHHDLQRRERRAPRPRSPTVRCFAARSWPGGRSSSAPVT